MCVKEHEGHPNKASAINGTGEESETVIIFTLWGKCPKNAVFVFYLQCVKVQKQEMNLSKKLSG